jgi:hypothetical protein
MVENERTAEAAPTMLKDFIFARRRSRFYSLEVGIVETLMDVPSWEG